MEALAGLMMKRIRGLTGGVEAQYAAVQHYNASLDSRADPQQHEESTAAGVYIGTVGADVEVQVTPQQQEGRWDCRVCDKVFNCRSARHHHMVRRHLHKRQEKARCTLCDYTGRNLSRHVRNKHADHPWREAARETAAPECRQDAREGRPGSREPAKGKGD